MNIQTLIEKIKEELDEIDTSTLHEDSVFTELEGWTSLCGLILMAMVSTEYGKELSGAQIRGIRTVGDLYKEISSSADR